MLLMLTASTALANETPELSITPITPYTQELVYSDISNSEAIPAIGEAIPYLTPDQSKKIDKMSMREVTVCPLFADSTGAVYYGGPSKTTSSWNTHQQSLGVSVTQAEKAAMDAYVVQEGYQLLGYYTDITFEIAGASTVSRRKIVSRGPVLDPPIATVNGINNGIYTSSFITTAEKPSLTWWGYFEYWMQFESMSTQTSLFQAWATF